MKYLEFTTGNNYLDEALENYLMHGLKPGGFLTSVLANDLSLSISRADAWNKDNLPAIVNAVVYSVPEISWGSYQRVRDWCSNKDGRQAAYAEYIREKHIIKKLKNSY